MIESSISVLKIICIPQPGVSARIKIKINPSLVTNWLIMVYLCHRLRNTIDFTVIWSGYYLILWYIVARERFSFLIQKHGKAKAWTPVLAAHRERDEGREWGRERTNKRWEKESKMFKAHTFLRINMYIVHLWTFKYGSTLLFQYLMFQWPAITVGGFTERVKRGSFLIRLASNIIIVYIVKLGK